VRDDGTARRVLNESPSGVSPFEDAAKSEARSVMNFQHRVLSTLLVDSDSTEPCSFAFADILEQSVAQTGKIFISSQSGSKVQLLDRTGPDDDSDLCFVGHYKLFRPDQTDAATEIFSDPEDQKSTICIGGRNA
jgi:hypothetical protein